jgi:hypothetical protein
VTSLSHQILTVLTQENGLNEKAKQSEAKLSYQSTANDDTACQKSPGRGVGGVATVNPGNVCEVCWDWTHSQLVVGEGRCFSRLLFERQSPEGRKGKLGVRGAGREGKGRGKWRHAMNGGNRPQVPDEPAERER